MHQYIEMSLIPVSFLSPKKKATDLIVNLQSSQQSFFKTCTKVRSLHPLLLVKDAVFFPIPFHNFGK